MDFDPPAPYLLALVAGALAEDLGLLGDITSIACIDADSKAEAAFVAREAGVLAGTAAATEVYRQVDPAVGVAWEIGRRRILRARRDARSRARLDPFDPRR